MRTTLLGALLGSANGVLGNLLAAWIEREWLNPFGGYLGVVIFVLTVVGSLTGPFLDPISERLPAPVGKDRRRSLLVLVVLALALGTGTSYVLLRVRPCTELQVSYLTLNLGTSTQYAAGGTILLDSNELARRSNLSGHVTFSLPALASRCSCEWWGRVNRRSSKMRVGEVVTATECAFSMPIDNAIHDIELQLQVGDKDAEGFQVNKTFEFRVSDGVLQQ